jgi:hypothetical protein
VAERSSISQSSQIGVESTPGTPVAAGKRLGSMGFKFAPKTTIKKLLPAGQKYASLQILGKEWTEAGINGLAVYPELPYAYACSVNTPTIAQITDGVTPTGAYRHTFVSNTFGDDAPKTLTIEQGSGVRAHRMANAIFREYTWAWSRDEIELGGTVLGRAIQDGVTLTASPTTLPQVPVRPSELSVYLDEAHADLGETKLLRALKGEFNIADRFDPLWVVDAAQASYAATIEVEPKVEFKVTQEANAQGMESLLAMRNGENRYLRLQAYGPVIYSAADPEDDIRHSVTIDMCGQVSDVGELGDEDGVYGVEWTFSANHDASWGSGKAFQIEVVTTTATL